MAWRDERSAYLHSLRTSDPVRLIMIFRNAHGLEELATLPSDYGYDRMIDAILDQEERLRPSTFADNGSTGPLDTP